MTTKKKTSKKYTIFYGYDVDSLIDYKIVNSEKELNDSLEKIASYIEDCDAAELMHHVLVVEGVVKFLEIKQQSLWTVTQGKNNGKNNK